MRKILLLIVALAIPFIYFCCESSSDMENMQQKSENSTLVTAAKKFLTGLNCDLSLPAQQKGASTRSLDYPTDATPVWEDARTEQNGDEQIVIIPLQGKEEIRSKAVITRGAEESFQFAKTFSRLIIRTKGESTIAHVVTYLPESEYAETHADKLASMGFYIADTGYTGIIIISSLIGNLVRSFIYEDGIIKNRMVPIVKHTHSEACTHDHSADVNMSIYMYSADENIAVTRGADDAGEYDFCPYCYQHKIYCKCTDWGLDDGEDDEDDFDDDLENPDACIRCGKYPCTCGFTVCIVCGKDPCLCHFDTEYCSVCGKEACICKDENKEDNEK